MRSWITYGEKNGKACNPAFGFLRCEVGLVPLCVRQGITTRAIAQYESCGVIVWWATGPEIASALARLVRLKQLNAGDSSRPASLPGASLPHSPILPDDVPD